MAGCGIGVVGVVSFHHIATSSSGEPSDVEMGVGEPQCRVWLVACSFAIMERNTKETEERATIIAQELKSFETLGTQRSRKAYLNDKDKVMPRRRNINKCTMYCLASGGSARN